ncbi:DUF488 family protein [Clostridium beijerinckii]|uniref:DUF488 domain-containing protein n=1 Tax=Clostridium beijerinckii TaxID=1520 RepID=UPI00031BFA99|nr:DUF488 domain-containing protein [Clostridium beijerinckii]
MKLYTIGFTKKSAEEFFNILKKNDIKKILDIRLNNSSQLAGFTKGNDLMYFLETICGIKYEHNIELAPTKEILSDYKNKKISWNEYENQFIDLINKRNLGNKILAKYVDEVDGICLLCSESTAENCHRRLVAEYIKNNLHHYDIEIVHL